eukprot:Gb_17368 [translate_table: standard]
MQEDYGLFVWPCSIVLAEYVWQQRDRICNSNVVEDATMRALRGFCLVEVNGGRELVVLLWGASLSLSWRFCGQFCIFFSVFWAFRVASDCFSSVMLAGVLEPFVILWFSHEVGAHREPISASLATRKYCGSQEAPDLWSRSWGPSLPLCTRSLAAALGLRFGSSFVHVLDVTEYLKEVGLSRSP